jgi:membrane-associated phospholipid phosphatase
MWGEGTVLRTVPGEGQGVSATVRRGVPVDEPGRREGPSHLAFVAGEVLLLVLLGALALILHAHPGPLPPDAAIERAVQLDLLHRGALTAGIEAISTVNWPLPTIITLALIVVVFLLLRRWLDVLVTPLAAAVSSGATYILSRWVHRPRPSGHGIHPLQHISNSFSFPSGHVTYAVAVFGLFLFLTFQVRRPFHPALVWMIRVVLVALIVLMPVSRVLEGEHWPSDVVGGALDGAFWLVLFAHLYLWMRAHWPRLLARDER